MKKLFAILLALCLLAGISAMADQEFVGPTENVDVYVHSYIPYEYNSDEQFTVIIPEGFDVTYPRASDSREVRIEINDLNAFPMPRGVNVYIADADNGIRGDRNFSAPNFWMQHEGDPEEGPHYGLPYAVIVDRYGERFGETVTVWRECDEEGNFVDSDDLITEFKKCPGWQDGDEWIDYSRYSDINWDENWANSVANMTVSAKYDPELPEGNYNDTLHFRIDTYWALNRDEMQRADWEYVSKEKFVDGDLSGIEGWEQVDGWMIMTAGGAVYYDGPNGQCKDEHLQDVPQPEDWSPVYWNADELFDENDWPMQHRIAYTRPIGEDA